jgi:hypothetical protein
MLVAPPKLTSSIRDSVNHMFRIPDNRSDLGA